MGIWELKLLKLTAKLCITAIHTNLVRDVVSCALIPPILHMSTLNVVDGIAIWRAITIKAAPPVCTTCRSVNMLKDTILINVVVHKVCVANHNVRLLKLGNLITNSIHILAHTVVQADMQAEDNHLILRH